MLAFIIHSVRPFPYSLPSVSSHLIHPRSRLRYHFIVSSLRLVSSVSPCVSSSVLLFQLRLITGASRLFVSFYLVLFLRSVRRSCSSCSLSRSIALFRSSSFCLAPFPPRYRLSPYASAPASPCVLLCPLVSHMKSHPRLPSTIAIDEGNDGK